jgi:hypothetical protein
MFDRFRSPLIADLLALLFSLFGSSKPAPAYAYARIRTRLPRRR